ncbi:MAG: hypothetical protein Fur0037_21760 [Planctomycetota bacterium]
MNDPARERRSAFAARAILVLLPLLLLAPPIFGGKVLVPYDLAAFPPASFGLAPGEVERLREGSNWDITEVPVWFLPEWRLSRGEIFEHGRFPSWNPWARNGTAIHGHGLLGLLYPPNWLMFLDEDPAPFLAWVVWADLAIAGLLAFGFLRQLGLSVLASLFGAALFQLGGPATANAGFWMRLGSLIWLPGTLWALLRISDEGQSRRRLGALSACIALPWLSGFPPYALASTLLAMAFAAVLLGARWRSGGRRAASRLLLPFGAGGILGVLLALPAVLPSLLFFAASARPEVTGPMLAANKFDWYGILALGLPDLFSHPSVAPDLPYDRSPLALWLSTVPPEVGPPSNYNYTEYALFLGTPGLFCALAGLFLARGRLRAPLLVLCLSAIGLATFTPPFRWLYALPGISDIFPVRWLPPSSILLAWLAATGFERLARPGTKALEIVTAAAFAAAAFAWFLRGDLGGDPAWLRSWLPAALSAKYGLPVEQAVSYVQQGAPADRFAIAQSRLLAELHRFSIWSALVCCFGLVLLLLRSKGSRGLFAAGAGVALAIAELALHGATLVRGRALEVPVETEVHRFLAERRASASGSGGFAVARASSRIGLPIQLPPGELMRHRIRDLHFDSHYDARSHRPLLKLFGREVAGRTYLTSALPDDERLRHPLLDLLGVRFLLATEPLRFGGERVGPRVLGPGGEFWIYERETCLSRAFVAETLRTVDGDDDAVAALVDAAFSPAREAVLTRDQKDKLGSFEPEPGAGRRRVAFVADHSSEIALHVSEGPRGLLVLSDTWMPGWSVYVDGERRELLRVDVSLRGVALPGEACDVRFQYDPPGLRWGLLAAAFALLALGAPGPPFGRSRTRARRAESPV